MKNGTVVKTKPKPGMSDSGYPISPVMRELHLTMSVRDLQRRTGIDVSHISRILSGLRTPSLDYAARITRATGVTLDQLRAAITKVQAQKARAAR